MARREAVRKYGGDQYSTETSSVPRPVNFLSIYLQLVSRSLIAQAPNVTISTPKREHRRTVGAMESWANAEIKKMDLADVLQRAGIDAIYGISIIKVGLASPGEAEKSGWTQQAGQPYACVVDPDDWVMDPHARTLRELAWCGHRVRVPLAAIKDSPMYEKAKRKKLKANVDRKYNESGDERISMIGRQYVSGDEDEAYDYVDLWEIYLPMEKLVVTLVSDEGDTPMIGEDEEPFHVQPWLGPHSGPYHFLNLMPPVSGNAMPKGPIQDLIDMDEAMNWMFQKLIDQGVRQKSLLLISAQADGDATRINEAGDGDTIRVDNPDKIKPAGFGGPDPTNNAFVLGLWDFLNKLGGNIELMGGLGQQSKTATQDKMLNANASASMRWMQQSMVIFTSKVIESLCWFWHHHPKKVMTSHFAITGLSSPIERNITPQDRQKVRFEEMEIKVEPFSLQYQSPEEKLAFLTQVVTQILMPLLPLLQQQGIGINIGRYLEYVAKYGSSPDLAEIVESIDVASAEPPGGDQPPKPGNTTRTYTRVNRSEATSAGQTAALRQTLLGQNPGGNPVASFGGPK